MPKNAVRPEDAFRTVEQYCALACFKCHSFFRANLIICGYCDDVQDCSAHCRRLDRKDHQFICGHLHETRELADLAFVPVFTTFPPTASDLNALLKWTEAWMMKPVLKRMGGRGGKTLNGLVFSVRRCAGCGKIHDFVEEGWALEGCDNCVYSWCNSGSCGETVEATHKNLCATLQQIVLDERLWWDLLKREDPVLAFRWLPEQITRVETSLPPDWDSFYASLDCIKPTLPEMKRIFARHSLSIPLTIVASLANFGLLPTFSDATDPRTLTVHLLGAEEELEIDGVGQVYEEIMHLLPGVRCLIVVMIGPGVKSTSGRRRKQSICVHCRRDGRTRHLKLFQMTYHDFIDSRPTSPHCDLALAFNSGICETPSSWEPTIAALLEARTPTVFTSCNSLEAKLDASAIERMGGSEVEWVWREEENPWRSGRQHFDLFSPGSIWSENMYWSGFQAS